MNKKKAYLKTIHSCGHNYNDINGEIIGVKYVEVNDSWRICYEVDHLNLIDYVPLSDVELGHYQIVDTIS